MKILILVTVILSIIFIWCWLNRSPLVENLGGHGGGGHGGGGWGHGGGGHRGGGWGRRGGYSGGYGYGGYWPYDWSWWYDPYYYVDVPGYRPEDSDRCNCSQKYKAAIDSGAPKANAEALLIKCVQANVSNLACP